MLPELKQYEQSISGHPIRKQGKSKDKWTKKFYHINADALKEYAPCSDETEDKKPKKPKKREPGMFPLPKQYGVWNKRKKQWFNLYIIFKIPRR